MQFMKGFSGTFQSTSILLQVACDRHAERDGSEVAIYYENKEGKASRYTFLELSRLSNQLANTLRHQGIGKGDRDWYHTAATSGDGYFSFWNIQAGSGCLTAFCFVWTRSCELQAEQQWHESCDNRYPAC